MAQPLDKFRRQLTESGLLPEPEVSTLLAGLTEKEQPRDGEQLARMLVRLKKLTPFQAQQVYAGKGKGLVLGNYVVLEKLGEGGMGMVLKARHKRMDRLVALKILSPAVIKTPDALQRFQREVKAAARLEHPHIVAAYDADEAAGTHFLVMQYVEGQDLAALVKTRGLLSPVRAIACILQAARGLEYAHARGIVHRDIKPGNLLIDGDGTVKVLDMGLARLESATGSVQDELTGTGQIMGTVDYMAPEQAMDTRIAGPPADIYSLGVTLWFLLTGRSIFEADTVVKKLMAHQYQAPPDLRKHCPEATPRLAAAFTKMVDKLPEDRFSSMTEVIAELEACRDEMTSQGAGGSTSPKSAGSRFPLVEGSGPVGAALKTSPPAKVLTTLDPDLAPTVALQAPQVGTDPQTQASLPSGLFGPAISVKTSARKAPGKVKQPKCPWWRTRTALFTALGLGVGGLLIAWAAIVFLLETKDGFLRVEINDPEIEVTIKGTKIVLKKADQGKDVELTPGDKVFVVERGDFKFETSKLVLKKGDHLNVLVEFVDGTAKVTSGDRVLGEQKMIDHALLFDGKGYVTLDLSLPLDEPLTFEAYVTPIQDKYDPDMILLGVRGQMALDANPVVNAWDCLSFHPNAAINFGYTTKVIKDKRVHLAFVREVKEHRLYVDGKLAEKFDTMSLALAPSKETFVIGRGFSGEIDEIRVSSKARYAADFKPEARFEPDAATLALYHCDEGKGTELKDASAHKRNGKVLNVAWFPGTDQPAKKKTPPDQK